jgi:hypothetical protein
MLSRGTMFHRAYIERNQTAAGLTGWGEDAQDVTPSFQPLATLACRAWISSRVESDSTSQPGGRIGKPLTISVLKTIVPKDSDVTERDRIGSIRNRLGTVLHAGPFKILTIIQRPDHLELLSEKVGG